MAVQLTLPLPPLWWGPLGLNRVNGHERWPPKQVKTAVLQGCGTVLLLLTLLFEESSQLESQVN